MAPPLANARVYVPNPISPDLRYGLFTVVPPIELPVHAQLAGLEYETPWCPGVHGYTVTCGAPGASKTFDGGLTDITGDPFVVYASSTCGTVGNWDTRIQDAVRQRLYVGEQGAVELAFSSQANGQAPGLSNNPAVVVLPAATTLTGGISALEQWLYATSNYGLRGIIHAPTSVSAYFHEVNTFLRDRTSDLPDVLRTPAGTAVSIGAYAGTDAGGGTPGAGHTTLYITGQMAIYRDPQERVFLAPYGETVNRTTNQFFQVAERSYVVTIDCFVAAIDVPIAA